MRKVFRIILTVLISFFFMLFILMLFGNPFKADAEEIKISWDPVPGAIGYYISVGCFQSWATKFNTSTRINFPFTTVDTDVCSSISDFMYVSVVAIDKNGFAGQQSDPVEYRINKPKALNLPAPTNVIIKKGE